MRVTDPLITIGLICYNAQNTILRALESAREQDWKNKEILIVDDFSTDNTIAIVQKFCAENPFLRIRLAINPSNCGVSVNRQTIIDQAHGEYIAFFDDDDTSMPNRLTAQYRRIIEFPLAPAQKILCYGDRLVHKKDGMGETVTEYGIGRKSPEPRGKEVSIALLSGQRIKGKSWGSMGAGTLMAHTHALRDLGFDASFRRGAEIEMAIRAGILGYSFISVPAPVIDQYITLAPHKSRWSRAKNRFSLLLRNQKFIVQERILLRSLLRYARYLLGLWGL